MPEEIVVDTQTHTHTHAGEAFDFYFRLLGMFVFCEWAETKALGLGKDLVYMFGL